MQASELVSNDHFVLLDGSSTAMLLVVTQASERGMSNVIVRRYGGQIARTIAPGVKVLKIIM